MDLSVLYILADDVEFIPIDAVHEKAKSAFEHEQEDVIVTQVKARTTSKVVSKNLASLLEEFRSPKTIADVIYFFSTSQQKDPGALADEVFDSLMNMKSSGILIPFDAGKDTLSRPSLKVNDTFRNYTIISNIRFLNDTEVYRVKDTKGSMFALKILKSGKNKSVKKLFDNETAILQSLDGLINPTLVEYGSDDENKFIITTWYDSISCKEEAMKYRNINNRDNLSRMLHLCVSILEAYQHLHEQKVLHGDVNADNVLISSTGSVKIIDYGYAFLEGMKRPHRGGTGFYYEPEFAVPYMAGNSSVLLTEKGEQYSLAVLIYLLIAGHHYLDFSFEKDKLYKQVAQEEPLSFKYYDLRIPDELDEVMKTALAKDPSKRFASLKHFSNALAGIRNKVNESSSFYIFNQQNPEKHFINFLLQKFGWASPFIQKGLSFSPTCSVNYGNSGIAYMFYRMSCVRQNAELSDLADIWINRALTYTNDYNNAFYSPAINITEKIVGKRSIYHSPAGIYIVQAFIANSRNDKYTFRNGVQKFLSIANMPGEKIDLTLGKAGLLMGCALLLKELLITTDPSITDIIFFAETIKNELWKQLCEHPPMNIANPVDYFGIAHGWAGLLYATLLWCSISNSDLPVSFMKRVEELLTCSIEDKRGIRWPYSVKDKNSWTGWCNGSAGYIFLLTALYKYFKDEKYIVVAEKTANYLLSEPLLNNLDLCCGSSGIAYSMLNLYKTTNDDKYLEQARRIKHKIIEKWHFSSTRNNSLYKGEVGIGILISEMNTPALAKMPLFE